MMENEIDTLGEKPSVYVKSRLQVSLTKTSKRILKQSLKLRNQL